MAIPIEDNLSLANTDTNAGKKILAVTDTNTGLKTHANTDTNAANVAKLSQAQALALLAGLASKNFTQSSQPLQSTRKAQ